MGRVFPPALLFVVPLAFAPRTEAQLADFGYITGRYDGESVQVELHLVTDGYEGLAAGFDVYRITLGVGECYTEHLTPQQPIAFPAAPFPTSITFSDASAQPNTAYHYLAYPVDAQHQRLPGGIPVRGEVTTGVALFAHGRIVYDAMIPGTGYGAFRCFGDCLSQETVLPPPDAVMPFVGTGTPLRLYGTVANIISAYNTWIPVFRIDHGSPSDCAVAVTPATWSTAKRLYR